MITDELERKHAIQRIQRELVEDANVKLALSKDACVTVAEIAGKIIDSYRKQGKLVLFGNGGSAADAQHLAAELVGRFLLHNRPPMAALALTVNTSVLTAIGNDFGYDLVFARQVEALVDRADVVIALSTSGNSPNVLKGVDAAKAKGAVTIGFTGSAGGVLADSVDIVLKIPSSNTQRIQEAHISIGHIVCGLVEEAVFECGNT